MEIKAGDKIVIRKSLVPYQRYYSSENNSYSLYTFGDINRYGGRVFTVIKVKRKYYPHPERVVIRHPRYGYPVSLSKEMFFPYNEATIGYYLERREAA